MPYQYVETIGPDMSRNKHIFRTEESIGIDADCVFIDNETYRIAFAQVLNHSVERLLDLFHVEGDDDASTGEIDINPALLQAALREARLYGCEIVERKMMPPVDPDQMSFLPNSRTQVVNCPSMVTGDSGDGPGQESVRASRREAIEWIHDMLVIGMHDALATTMQAN